ncbi:OLC1v1021280C1 [Oldenlandia corymbosa var. corymbosa]|uniref:OLC1v1021280C1 n=1 Tax=Oldenlandia corymbosa var. corymbosa TaxID=529605 RepID=A0AAV1BXS0_OLDCO|nr:OLC1v1021280C1 [Oldenlandia corymbosa var. corymbosa]
MVHHVVVTVPPLPSSQASPRRLRSPPDIALSPPNITVDLPVSDCLLTGPLSFSFTSEDLPTRFTFSSRVFLLCHPFFIPQQQWLRITRKRLKREVGEDPSTSTSQEYASRDENTVMIAQQEQHVQVVVENFTPGRPMYLGTPKDSVFSPSPQQKSVLIDQRRKETITIVDYGHDEVAVSPEQEEGEVMVTEQSMQSEDRAVINGDFQDKTGLFQTLNGHIAHPQQGQSNDQVETDETKRIVNISPSAEGEGAVISEESNDTDLLNKFLPPPPKAKCSDELQAKIMRFLTLKRGGLSFNAEVRNRKDYRNPDFLRHAVTYQDIDEIGSCFSKDVFDPHGYDKSDFFDEIEADMRREMERKEQERKRSPRIDFFSGGTQVGAVPTPKINLPITGLQMMPGGAFNAVPTARDPLPRDGRQNKKSKWDKVDGDGKTLLSTGGPDSVSAAAAQAAILSAVNASGGYSAYAEQRRREAEDYRRSSDRKSDRKS